MPSSRPLHVLIMGSYDPIYPRHQIIRTGLERLGVNVTSYNIPKGTKTITSLPRLASHWQLVRDCDLVFVPSFNQLLAPIIWTISRFTRTPIIADYMVGLTDAIVHEREEGTIFQRVLWWNVDKFVVRNMLTLTDTAAHIGLFRDLWGIEMKRIEVLPVGAYDPWFYEQPQPPADGPQIVQFFGTYIPFHGVDVIIDAIQVLQTRHGNDPAVQQLEFELIGTGKTYNFCRQRADSLHLKNVNFIPYVQPTQLPDRIAKVAIALGVFGPRDKTDYVVANKCFQSMAVGRAVITGEAPAVDEIFRPGTHLVTVPTGNPVALAEEIYRLLKAPEERARLGQNAAAIIRERFLPQHIGAILKPIIESVVAEQRKTRRDGA